MINALAAYNTIKEKEIVSLRNEIISREQHRQRPAPRSSRGLGKIEALIIESLKATFPNRDATPQFKNIERGAFGADIAVTIPSMLKEFGAKTYGSEYVPQIVTALHAAIVTTGVAQSVEAKGMYVNVKLHESVFITSLKELEQSSLPVVENSNEIDRRIVIDYSAPNVAKKLHAGHIRTTIIGHILVKLHRACGATVFGVNHINDFGGFGFLITGLKRWSSTALSALTDEEKMVELYRIRRTCEKVLENETHWSSIAPEDALLMKNCFGAATQSYPTLIAAIKEYIQESDHAFELLEQGSEAEVKAWDLIVTISLADFAKFYDALNIHIDFTIGESFYYDAGIAVIHQALKNGNAVRYTQQECDNDIATYRSEFEAGTLSQELFDKAVEEAKADIGAIVVRLTNRRRLVALRSDGRSIYATRDLGALSKRRDLFNPTDIIYVVGQEQRDHFASFFEAGKIFTIFGQTPPSLLHLYFGFYVDATTKKKLSSRDGAAGVTKLLADAAEYFYQRLAETEFPEAEKRSTAKELSIASLIFNDLEKDMKGAVEIDTTTSLKTIEKFEKAGGAYVIYTACRAKALVRRFTEESKSGTHKELHVPLSDQEVRLALLLLRTSDVTAQAASTNNPSLLVRHLIDISQAYSSYYASSPVFDRESGSVYVDRVLFASVVHRVLVDGLALCNVTCPGRI